MLTSVHDAGLPVFAFIFIIYFFMLSISIGIAVAQYVLQALGLRGMLRSIGYAKTWHAFVPFCNAYAMGYLADCYNDGKPKTNYAKRLLGLNIATLAVVLPMMFLIIALMVASTVRGETTVMSIEIVFLLLAMIAIYVAVMVLAVIYAVNSIKAVWRIYRIFAPEQSILFLMLSIFVSPAMAVIFFIIRSRAPRNLRFNGNGEADPYIPYQ